MKEGWIGDDYIVLFAESDVPLMARRYGIESVLPGCRVVGLRGWDDFVIVDQEGGTFTVPTVPCALKDFRRFQLPDENSLVADARFAGKVKWYITPIAFGGAPDRSENITWVTYAQHADLVRWWNAKFRESSRSTGDKESHN